MAAMAHRSVLVICSHNRTRSVMAAGLLAKYLDDRFVVESAGFGSAGFAATPDSVRLLAGIGIDASPHRSRRVTPEMVATADVVLCAERQHVLAVVAELGGRFERTFTLPEFAAGAGVATARPSGLAYLHSVVPEVDDPTGRSATTWSTVWNQLEAWCAHASARLMA